jgi:phosphoribosyl-AMP cyclohydrolase
MRNVPLTQIPDFSDANRLLPAVAQDAATGKVLMLAYMNRAAWEQTLATGEATYFSRSRGKLWKKGEESGNVQRVREIFVDCDGDTILLKVEQEGGAACHQGYESCFFRQWDGKEFQSVGRRVFDPQQVYGSG